MSRTKARVISSLRMWRCSQRRNKTNCTPAEMMAVKTAYQWAGMGGPWEVEEVKEVNEVKDRNWSTIFRERPLGVLQPLNPLPLYFLNLLYVPRRFPEIIFGCLRNQKNAPGRAPRVEPRPEPRAEKNPPPLLREALLRTLSSSAGMPRVRPRRLESTPKRPESPCSAAICRWNAVLVKAS